MRLSLCALLLTGCERSLDPAATGGTAVPGTQGVQCDGSRPLAVSPDERWLAFSAARSGTERPALKLVDLEREAVYVPEPTRTATERISSGHGPNVRTLCWSADSAAAYLSGPSLPVGAADKASVDEDNVGSETGSRLAAPARRVRRSNWFAVSTARPGRLRTVAKSDCIEQARAVWRFGAPQTDVQQVTRGLEIRRESAELIELVLSGGRVLAAHTTQAALSDRIGVSTYTWSPDGRRLAYVITEGFGMGGAPARAYWVDAVQPDDEPTPLATAVEALIWRNDEELLACVQQPDGAANVIVRWVLPI